MAYTNNEEFLNEIQEELKGNKKKVRGKGRNKAIQTVEEAIKNLLQSMDNAVSKGKMDKASKDKICTLLSESISEAKYIPNEDKEQFFKNMQTKISVTYFEISNSQSEVTSPDEHVNPVLSNFVTNLVEIRKGQMYTPELDELNRQKRVASARHEEVVQKPRGKFFVEGSQEDEFVQKLKWGEARDFDKAKAGETPSDYLKKHEIEGTPEMGPRYGETLQASEQANKAADALKQEVKKKIKDPCEAIKSKLDSRKRRASVGSRNKNIRKLKKSIDSLAFALERASYLTDKQAKNIINSLEMVLPLANGIKNESKFYEFTNELIQETIDRLSSGNPAMSIGIADDGKERGKFKKALSQNLNTCITKLGKGAQRAGIDTVGTVIGEPVLISGGPSQKRSSTSADSPLRL